MAYITRAELEAFGGLPARVVGQITSPVLSNKLDAATAMADGYLRIQYAVPMTAPSMDLKIRVAHVAAYMIMGELGFNPEVNPDQIVVKNYDDALRWFEQVAAGRVALVSTADGTPDVNDYGPEVETDDPRGW